MQLIAPAAKTGRTLTVVNPLGFARTEPMRVKLPKGTVALQDSAGRTIPVQKLARESVFIAEGVPAFSRKHYKILSRFPKGVSFEDMSVTRHQDDFGFWAHEVETAHAVALISHESGAIVSYKDKALGRDLVPYGTPRSFGAGPVDRSDFSLNVFQVIDETSGPNNGLLDMSAWNIHRTLREESLLAGAEVKVLDAGPVFVRLRVKHAFRSSHIEEDIIFYRDFPRVDFKATIDWREQGSNTKGIPQLKVSFATGMSAARARVEGPFTVVERPANGLELPTQKWSALTGDEFGFALYNDSKYGCDALGSRMRMTLLRNSFSPDPNSDNGRHVVRFAFEPHAAGQPAADLVRGGMAFNRACLTAQTEQAVRGHAAMLKIEGADSVVCTALRRAEHSDGLLVRLFETSGKPCKAKVKVGKGIRSAREVNFHENPLAPEARVEGGEVPLKFRAFEVKTLLVEADGIEQR
jgi:alpha-mannosidase